MVLLWSSGVGHSPYGSSISKPVYYQVPFWRLEQNPVSSNEAIFPTHRAENWVQYQVGFHEWLNSLDCSNLRVCPSHLSERGNFHANRDFSVMESLQNPHIMFIYT